MFGYLTLFAEIKLPAIVSSNMVLQRDAKILLWGWADSKEQISISGSWFEESKMVKSSKDGYWELELQTTNSKEPQTINLESTQSSLLLENILFGEVWVCSGQSNMQQPMKGFRGQPTVGAALAIAKSKNPNLRLFTLERQGSKTPQKEIKDFQSWAEASPENIVGFSAVAYFFGKQLQEILDVPVGLIHTSWGGSRIEAWMSKESLTKFQPVDLQDRDISIKTNHVPTALFNAMIHPIMSYSIKGVLWYQGESNRDNPESYMQFFPEMVADWRERWALGDFPFYYVQIAPFKYRKDNTPFQSNENTAFLREAQLKCFDKIPNSGMVVTLDIGAENSIHPPKKKEVADRLLFNALNHTYGYESVDRFSPIYDSMAEEDGALILSFKHAENGLYTHDSLTGFEIAGSDRVFYPAIAKIVDRKNVSVKSAQVKNPVAVRYAWRNWVEGSLFDTNLLPASSFRTDAWDNATKCCE
ncbi:MAG: sialate O-acetylesterase [Bacteroidota bacterium]